MKLRSLSVFTSLALALASVGFADDSLQGATSNLQADLDTALKELSELREQVTAEKLPLTKQLGQLEEELADLRRQNDEALRQLDTGALETSTLGGEAKLRDDELGYVTNLLDEFARGLESKLGVGEFTRYREPIEIAKAAIGNNSISLLEKFTIQLSVVDAAFQRARDVIGGTTFPGSAVDPQGIITEGKFAHVGPLAFFSSTDGRAVGVAMLQASSLQAAVRPLEATLTRGIAALVASGVGEVPLDPTRGSALKELVQRTSLIHIFKQGGPIMWPLLVVSILALAAVIERTLFLVNERRRRNEEDVQELLGAVQEGNIEKAVRIGSASKDYVARAMTYALQHREKSLANALMYANAQEVKRFSRGLPVLDTAITIAPLLGLLGTVTGMMHSFSLIGGDLSAPGAITGGIAEALIATAFGLGIAIIALIPFNVLNSKIDEARHALEAASAQIELLVHPPAGPMNALAMAASHGRIA
jgi:biopolymer transport protein ExbB